MGKAEMRIGKKTGVMVLFGPPLAPALPRGGTGRIEMAPYHLFRKFLTIFLKAVLMVAGR